MKRIKYLFIITLTILLTGCDLFKRDTMENINIITTIYPLEYATNYLYGDSSNVTSIYPDDVNTDTYELTEKQLKDNSKKDLFIYMGLSNDSDIAIKLIERNKNLKVIDATYGMEYKKNISELWLNPSNLLMILQNIKNGLDEYIDNNYIKLEIEEKYNELKMILSEMDANIKTTMANADKKTIYCNSESFMFLEKYGINVIPVFKEDDLYEKNLALLEDAIEKEQVKYFYVIEDSELTEEVKKLVDDKKILTLDFRNLKNITDEERNLKKNYEILMEKNIEELKKELY